MYLNVCKTYTYLLMQLQLSIDNSLHSFLYGSRKPSLGYVLGEDTVVDSAQCFSAWKADCKHTEVALQAGVDGEAPCSRVHTGHILHIGDILQC